MTGAWLQFVASGLTAGAIYALVALGFSIIYNASGAINFAQGEFVMIGGMTAAALVEAGVPLAFSIIVAIGTATAVGLLDRAADAILQFAQEGFGLVGLLAHCLARRFGAASLARRPRRRRCDALRKR